MGYESGVIFRMSSRQSPSLKKERARFNEPRFLLPRSTARLALVLGEVVAVVVHDFVPGGGEGLDEVGGGVGGGVAFGDAAELGVGAEDEVDAGAGPF